MTQIMRIYTESFAYTLAFFPAFLWFVRSKAMGIEKYPKIGLV